ncbi:MAG: hypothetical protein RL660_2747 [Bacteroidota bacterium]|jgi:hypothetical protein
MDKVIIIDNKMVSTELLREQFVCNLDKCKGACCVDGDTGAPLEEAELDTIDEVYPIVEKYLTKEAKARIKKVGRYHQDEDFGYVTPDINGGVCVYGLTDEKGIVKCAFEQAYNNGEIAWKKPISCHLFPIRIGRRGMFESLEYEPREDICAPACSFGKKLGVPVYKFLEESITRKYGEEFYEALEQIADTYYK